METRTAGTARPTATEADEIAALRSEVERLRTLVGPSEDSYRKLRLDLLGARDHAIAAEAQVGHLRGQIEGLRSENFRLRRSARYAVDVLLARIFGPSVLELLRPAAGPARQVLRIVRRIR